MVDTTSCNFGPFERAGTSVAERYAAQLLMDDGLQRRRLEVAGPDAAGMDGARVVTAMAVEMAVE